MEALCQLSYAGTYITHSARLLFSAALAQENPWRALHIPTNYCPGTNPDCEFKYLMERETGFEPATLSLEG